MRIRRIRLRKEYRLKVWLFIFSFFSLCFILIPQPNRAWMTSFLSRKCNNYQQSYSTKLNDRIVEYSTSARSTGIETSSDATDIREKVSSGQLFRVRSGRYYEIENLTHSYPYLTRDSKMLLYEIGKRFRGKIDKRGFKGSRFIVTSMTRTSEETRKLGRTNINASNNSPHLYGNAFDISYAHFSFRKLYVTECDKWYMKEALAEVIYKLKEENKCWATYESRQGCFHIVSK
ncbi:MAG: DUF5715 family protein [Bacteroidota bacterium]|nr:DUF5715 family protein [Bacteroidota bacterium]